MVRKNIFVAIISIYISFCFLSSNTSAIIFSLISGSAKSTIKAGIKSGTTAAKVSVNTVKKITNPKNFKLIIKDPKFQALKSLEFLFGAKILLESENIYLDGILSNASLLNNNIIHDVFKIHPKKAKPLGYELNQTSSHLIYIQSSESNSEN